MPIGRRPSKVAVQQERAVEDFISAAGKHGDESDTNKKPAMIRFDPELLKKIDVAAKKRGVSRSAWVQFVCSRALEQGEG